MAEKEENTSKENPLHTAIKLKKEIEEIEKLLKQVDINTVDETSTTPLMCSVKNNSPEIFKLLMNYGADLNQKNNSGESCLALTHTIPEMLPLVLSYNPDINSVDNDHRTLLHKVAENGMVEQLLMLIEAGADLNIESDELSTPIFEAMIEGQYEVFKILVMFGANYDFFVKSRCPIPELRIAVRTFQEFKEDNLADFCRMALRNYYGTNYYSFVSKNNKIPSLLKEYLLYKT